MSSRQATLENWRNPTGRKQHKSRGQTLSNNVPSNVNIGSEMRQSYINTIIGNDDFNTWGHQIQDKTEEDIRIAFRNINYLPHDKLHNKNDILIQEIRETQVDVYCANEINIAWQNIEAENNLYERFKGKLEFAKYICSNNHDPNYIGIGQSGGTLTVLNGNICGRIIESGKEKHMLQRWSWVKLRGQHNKSVVIVNTYRPVKSNGILSAYQQHKRGLLTLDIDECPRANLLQCLKTQILEWHKEGNQVILTGDFNEDINGKNIQKFLSDVGLVDLIQSQHGVAPNTNIHGSKPIDGIFGSTSLTATRSGFMSFAWGLSSDHRLIWVDIHSNKLLGNNAPKLWKPQTRRLKCNDPNIVSTFNKLRKEYLQKHRGFDLYNEISSSITAMEDKEWEDKIEALDELRTASMIYAEKKCRRIRMGSVPWSPELQAVMNRISYLQRCRMKYINGRRIRSRTLKESFDKTDYDKSFSSPDEIIKQLKLEFKTYKELKNQAEKLRVNFLEQLAASQANESNLTQKKIYLRLLLHESIRQTFRKIRYAINDDRKGVTMIEAQDTTGQWQVVTNKEEIEAHCALENISRFTQAKNSPTMQEDQIKLFGWQATTAAAQRILNGEQVCELDVHQEISDMIPFLSTPDKIRNAEPICETILEDEYIWRWNRSREFTSTGTSGLHFGHFQASCKDRDLCQLDRWMTEYALSTGYSFKRWQKGIDVMIPKKSGSNRVDKLRTIVLMEPDFNFVNKLIGKRTMAMAEKAGTLAPEQFGSRKKKSAIVHAINKQITTDIIRQEKRDFCVVILDAKGCYDRITPMYAAFAMRRQGATPQMVNVIFETIAEMQHSIRTSYGDSKLTYRQTNERFHGILQGNGAGPTIWALISSTLLDRLRHRGIGVIIPTSSGYKLQIPAFAFVDDTDILQELETGKPSPQDAVNEWNSALQTTGGLIIGDKCMFQIIRHRWKKDKWILENVLDDTVTITIPDDSGQKQNIRQSLPAKGELALGVAFSPTGDMSDEVTYLRNKSSKWGDKVLKANLTNQEAWIALSTTIMKTIEYPLAATLMTRKEIHHALSPALNVGLSKSGICKKISRNIIFCPNKFQGFGIKDPYVTQGIRKLELLFNPYNQLTQELIQESWRRTEQEVGIGPNFFQQAFSTYKAITTKSWITSLWEFLSDIGVQLQKLDTINRFRTETDSYLMQRVCEIREWTNDDKIIFNNCRLYLRVELLSDIMTANGSKIRHEMMAGVRNQWTETFVKHSIKIEKPSQKAWQIWKKCCNERSVQMNKDISKNILHQYQSPHNGNGS
jgi:Reverse transcriptase (RNA-dependent DNA polymerase)